MDLDSCDRIFDDVLSSTTEAEFCHRIAPLLEIYEILSVELGRGRIFWRARAVESAIWTEVSDLDYPGPALAKRGRLNDAGSPCFYVSKDIHTALLEVESQEGQLIQVGGFRVLTEDSLRVILVGEYANVQKTGYMRFTGTDPGGSIRRSLNQYGPRGMSMLYIDKFLAGILADPEARCSDYRFSRALGAMLHAKVTADGIAFPSVRDPGGFNLAVKPEPSDRVFHNVACVLTKIGKRRRFSVLDYELVSSAVHLDDEQRFVWPAQYQTGQLNLYGMNKEEFDFASGRPDDKETMNDLFSFYS